MIDVRCPLCKNRYSCKQMGMIPLENCGMFVIDDTIKRHKTNADRIRAMTDVELATWINHMQADAYGRGIMEMAIVNYPNTYSNWLDWLRQEVHDGKEEKEENQPAK